MNTMVKDIEKILNDVNIEDLSEEEKKKYNYLVFFLKEEKSKIWVVRTPEKQGVSHEI